MMRKTSWNLGNDPIQGYATYQNKHSAFVVLYKIKAGKLDHTLFSSFKPEYFKVMYHPGSTHLPEGWYIKTARPAGAVLPGPCWIQQDWLFWLTGNKK